MLYKPSLLGANNEKTKRILMCEDTVFLRTVNARHFQICVACSFLRKKRSFFRVSATPGPNTNSLTPGSWQNTSP